MTTPVLAVRAVLDGAYGPLVIDAENEEAYELHPDTKADMSVSWRKQEAANDWVEGSYATSAVRENSVETVAIWVNGANSGLVAQRKNELLRRLGLLTYTFELTIDGVTQLWTCQPADFSVSEKQEYMFQPTALVVAKIPRLPKITVSGDFGSFTT